jgi:hexokinase
MMLPPCDHARALEDDVLAQMRQACQPGGPGGNTSSPSKKGSSSSSKSNADAPPSSILMLPTWVTQLPTGEERGACFAVDIGGTNFRVAYIKLGSGPGEVEAAEMEQVAIPRHVYTGTAEQLFDFLARPLARLVQRVQASGALPTGPGAPRPAVGFCWSFPLEQTALDAGRLLRWTKGFDVPGVVGSDPVRLLSAALERLGSPCRVACVLNDSVAVLAAGRYFDQRCEMGVILGTGTNACVALPAADVPKWRPPPPPAGGKGGGGGGGRPASPAGRGGGGGGSGKAGAGAAAAATATTTDLMTAINTEWGCYGSPLLPSTPEDAAMDAASGCQKGTMLMEKMMSGLWLGEIARRILLTFAERAALFGPGGLPAGLCQPGAFTTAHLSAVESDRSLLLAEADRVLSEALGTPRGTLPFEALRTAQQLCRLVVRRSARLAARLLAATLRQQRWTEKPRTITIAVDGGVVLKYANWRRYLDEYLAEALGGGSAARMVHLRATPDGSSLGAAVLAAAAARGGEEGGRCGSASAASAAAAVQHPSLALA